MKTACTSLSAETTPKTRAGEGRNGSDKEAGNPEMHKRTQ